MKLSQVALFAALSGCPALSYADTHFGVGFNIDLPVSTGVVVTESPPPVVEEQIGPAPGPNFTWVGGHWAWKGPWRRWVWVRGHWVVPPYATAAWAPGHWAQSPNGWVWVGGQWLAQQAPPASPQGAEVYVDQTPPPPIYEVANGPAPGPDFFWIGGYWGWSGGWVWHRGHYDRHPNFHPGAGWEAGRWDHRDGHFYWRPGHWR